MDANDMITINYLLNSGTEKIDVHPFNQTPSNEGRTLPLHKWYFTSMSSNYYAYTIHCHEAEIESRVKEVREIVKDRLFTERNQIQKSIDTVNKPLILIYDSRKKQGI